MKLLGNRHEDRVEGRGGEAARRTAKLRCTINNRFCCFSNKTFHQKSRVKLSPLWLCMPGYFSSGYIYSLGCCSSYTGQPLPEIAMTSEREMLLEMYYTDKQFGEAVFLDMDKCFWLEGNSPPVQFWTTSKQNKTNSILVLCQFVWKCRFCVTHMESTSLCRHPGGGEESD